MTKGVWLAPRALMLLTIAAALLGGMGAGLSRLGVPADPISRNWMLVHGPLMISGFLGTLICLERAVALASRYRWSIAVPAVNALGAFSLLAAPDAPLAKWLLTAGSAGLVILFALMLRLHPTRDVVIMAIGSQAWLAGNVLWLSGQPIFHAVHPWTAFLILTIVGERLELSRVRRLTVTAERLLVLAVAVYVGGIALSVYQLDAGTRLFGVGAVLMAAWLLRYDIARRTIQQTGLPRYIAACLLAGYGWLAVGGLLAVWNGATYAGADYSAILHSFLLGFVFSMIFGHMPIIFPALTGLKVSYTPVFYVHLFLLHATLLHRQVAALTGDLEAQQSGGTLNVIAVLLFLAVTAVTVVRSNFIQRPRPSAA